MKPPRLADVIAATKPVYRWANAHGWTLVACAAKRVLLAYYKLHARREFNATLPDGWPSVY